MMCRSGVGRAHAFCSTSRRAAGASAKEEVTIAVSTVERVRGVVGPLLSERDMALYDLEVAGSQVRVTVETTDLAAIEELTRAISRGLDAADPIAGRYTLEVSSPGLERALRVPEHFRGAIGVRVKLKTRPDVDGERRVDGILSAADDDAVTVDGRRLHYDEIERARTVFEWGPAPKPGSGSPKRTRAARGATSGHPKAKVS